MSSPDTGLTGALLGNRYRIGKLAGEGGMGAVYEATQEDLQRRVAIKVLHASMARDPALVQRFRREAVSSASLGHPNIVGVIEFQANPGEPPFLVMEFLEGESLRAALRRDGPMGARRAARIARQVLSALSVAHKAHIVHRDIKPDNIFLVSGSALTDFVKVFDFGVAKLLGPGGARPLTQAGTLLGTLHYMAPEQARGDDVDGRADIYAMAACLFFATAGQKPIDAKSETELLWAIQERAPLALLAARPDIDPAFAAIVDRGLQKKPADRFDTADDMERALGTWLDTPEAIRPTAPRTTEAPRPSPGQLRAMARGGTVPMRASVPPVGAPSQRVTAPMPAAPPIEQPRSVAPAHARSAIPSAAPVRHPLPPTLRSMQPQPTEPARPRMALAVVLVLVGMLAIVALTVLGYVLLTGPAAPRSR